jgi:hypothetical protein
MLICYKQQIESLELQRFYIIIERCEHLQGQGSLGQGQVEQYAIIFMNFLTTILTLSKFRCFLVLSTLIIIFSVSVYPHIGELKF